LFIAHVLLAHRARHLEHHDRHRDHAVAGGCDKTLLHHDLHRGPLSIP
jgi:hypothetical protein